MSDLRLQNIVPDNDQTRARREHLEALRQLVGNVYPNKFERSNVTESVSGEDTITSVIETFKHFEPHVSEGEKPSAETLESANTELNKIRVRLAGRIAAPPRVMGKAAFVHLSDGTSRLQIYARRQDFAGVRNDAQGGEVDGWEMFGLLDHGDFIGVAGYLFVTRTGELSLHVEKLQFLAKALLPMPDKMHGIHDPEIRQRQRYADLIAGSLKLEREKGDLTPREVFELRSKVVREIRRFLDEHGYIEVETPMLTPLATGAAARPFKTHHNALDIDLYARIAPELYLKRLVVGGFERVYELNRNFRNEGISSKHNPEFTMLEFYAAYMDVNGMMDFCEELLRRVVSETLGSLSFRFTEYGPGLVSDEPVVYAQHEIDLSRPFERLSMKQAISKVLSKMFFMEEIGEQIDEGWLSNASHAQSLLQFVNWWFTKGWFSYLRPYPEAPSVEELESRLRSSVSTQWRLIVSARQPATPPDVTTDETIVEIFDRVADGYNTLNEFLRSERSNEKMAKATVGLFKKLVQDQLIQPIFITDFPKAISPLAKASTMDRTVAERFELFVGKIESANGFSELNDPEEQYQRFKDQEQQRERGDQEAMVMDEDYIRALSYGMPPAAGIGVGIDRLVMLLANKQSIRDVILFPHLKPEKPGQESGQ